MLAHFRTGHRRRPPKRSCRGCGKDVYSWTETPLCGDCTQKIVNEPPAESLRDFRRRVIDPGRNE